MFGSEKNRLSLVLKRTLVANLSTIEKKDVEGSHITVVIIYYYLITLITAEKQAVVEVAQQSKAPN